MGSGRAARGTCQRYSSATGRRTCTNTVRAGRRRQRRRGVRRQLAAKLRGFVCHVNLIPAKQGQRACPSRTKTRPWRRSGWRWNKRDRAPRARQRSAPRAADCDAASNRDIKVGKPENTISIECVDITGRCLCLLFGERRAKRREYTVKNVFGATDTRTCPRDQSGHLLPTRCCRTTLRSLFCAMAWAVKTAAIIRVVQGSHVLVPGALRKELSSDLGEQTIRNVLSSAMSGANAIVFETAQNDKKLTGMGTTMILAVFLREILYIACVGDSRVYCVLAAEQELQLTRDHTVVQMLVDIGEITPRTRRPIRSDISSHGPSASRRMWSSTSLCRSLRQGISFCCAPTGCTTT